MSSAAVALPAPSTIPAPVAASANSVASDSKDGAGAEGQVSAVPSKASEYNLPPTARKRVTEPDEGDDGGCLERLHPWAPVPPHSVPGCKNLRRPLSKFSIKLSKNSVLEYVGRAGTAG